MPGDVPCSLNLEAAPAPDRKPVTFRSIPFLIPLVCGLLYAAQCLWFINTQSLVYDEPAHIMTGLDAWRHGEFERWNDQPPLGRLLLTVPLLRGNWQIEKLGRIRPSPEAVAWHTRPVNVALGLLLGAQVWATTRRLFGAAAGNLTLALFALSPPLIAHFSLATVDGLATLMVLVSAVQLARWWRDPSWRQTIVLGATLGGLLIAKFSAPPLFMLALGLVLLRNQPVKFDLKSWNWTKAAAVLGLAFLIVWSAYFFHSSPVTFRSGRLAGPYAAPHTVIVPVAKPLQATLRVPAGEYLTGLGLVLQHNLKGQPSFFLGTVSKTGGRRLYFLVVVLLKWPLPVWLLALAAGALAIGRRLEVPRELLLMTLFPAVVMALAIWSNLNIGDRYVLPVYPFLLLWSGGAVKAVNGRRPGRVLLVSLVLLEAADCARYGPDYLSYFNFFVRPERSYQLLTDSNLDWGQGLVALRKYEIAHSADTPWLAYFGGVDPSQYGIRSRKLGEADRVTGTVIVSATHLSGQYLDNPTSYRWVLRYRRKVILDHTLHVFEVPPGASP